MNSIFTLCFALPWITFRTTPATSSRRFVTASLALWDGRNKKRRNRWGWIARNYNSLAYLPADYEWVMP